VLSTFDKEMKADMKRTLLLKLTICLLPLLILLLFSIAPQVGAWQASAPAREANAAPTCANAAVHVNSDYRYASGSADFSDADGDPETGSTYRWLRNGVALSNTQFVSESLLLHFDNAANGANGETPSQSQGVTYTTGKWGSALVLTPTGYLRFPRQYNFDPTAGTVEMWVALRVAGSDPVYSSTTHTLFQYRVDSNNWIGVSQSTSGILYAGGTVNSQWESAYGSRGSMRGWNAGEWHHLAFTYSTAGNFMRFYVDGVLTADTNEHHYWAPPSTGLTITIGGASSGTAASYLLDEVRLSGRVLTPDEIVFHAKRFDQPHSNEISLALSGLSVGDSLTYVFTPTTPSETGTACQSAPWIYPGFPLANPQPPSTVLLPGSTAVTLTATSLVSTTCAYAVGSPLPYAQMTPFDLGNGTQTHQSVIGGLDTNPNVVNQVYVRCASHPDYLMSLKYRVRANVNPSYPRTGNLWGWSQWIGKGLPYMSRVDLWLGADPTRDQVLELRRLNPNVLILTSINAVENGGLPDDYYLKDINGNRIEVWPGTYRLNLTKLVVAEYQAHYAYQRMLDGGLLYDGVFFDNVFTTQAWQTRDIYGNLVAIDSDENGVADDPAILDANWKAGVFHELRTFRQLMPYALVSNHAANIAEPGIAEIFNGISFGFLTADVLEGERSFTDVWDRYNAWMTQAKTPPLTMFEASPPDQIAYGYDYSPLQKIPTSTLEFARTLYPYMRFGLALTLMKDGYFAYEFGDTWHGNDWWYDELDFDLGQPIGPAQRADVGFDIGPNLIVSGSFESAIVSPWKFSVDSSGGYSATLTRDTTTAAQGSASARVDIISTAGTDWRISFYQDNRSLVKGSTYDLAFWAKSDVTRTITLGAQKNATPWTNYGLGKSVTIDSAWRPYTVTFESNATANDARLQFFVGAVTGTVWLDDFHLTLHPPDVYQREFTNGMVLLNGSKAPQTLSLGKGYQRLVGTQAPRFETLLDDAAATFTLTAGTWPTATLDSGEWKAAGPFYHDWGESVHQLNSVQGEVRWSLPISATDVYTITAWWPAAPEASTWNQNAIYEVVASGQVVASAALNQTTGGDEWHLIGAVSLSPPAHAYVRLRCQGAPCMADALYLQSRARYNDGSLAMTVTLQPLDGIVLQRAGSHWLYLPLIRK
jgi:hypothetical protein